LQKKAKRDTISMVNKVNLVELSTRNQREN